MSSPCVAVAWSGGRDSTALLYATAVCASPLGVRVVALHVHHGLSDHADDWLIHCEQQCRHWARHGVVVTLQVERLASQPLRGQSVEAWARQARYAALQRMAVEQGASLVLLAHHRRDQAETWLLQALRGAGSAGLSSMPRQSVRGGITWLRPWLDTPRSEIEDYVRRHRLEHIDDDTNDDARFARNRLRLKVWPALTQAFPEAETTLADSATWAQEADACLDELAQLDLQRIADTTGWRVADAAGLSAPRRSNALRHWLRQQLGRPAESSLLTRMLDELRAPGPHRWTTKEGELRHYRGRLKFESRHLGAASTGGREQQLRIQRAGRYRLPGWGGELRVRRVPQGGVPLAWLAHVCVLARGGGERYQAGPGRPPRSLKKQFQARGVPAWARDAPLFFSGGQLVFVPGLGIDARAIGLPGQAQVSLEWLPTAHTG